MSASPVLAPLPPSEAAFRVREGRVHLTVQRERESGREIVGLKAPLFDEPWQDEVTTSTVATALAMLGETPSLARVLELAQAAVAATSRLVNGLLARAPAGSVACKAGCDHCCHVVVGVTAPEALLIFDLRPLELSSAMHVLFEHGATATADRLAGGHPFDAALCAAE